MEKKDQATRYVRAALVSPDAPNRWCTKASEAKDG
jgi:hypothetical protein